MYIKKINLNDKTVKKTITLKQDFSYGNRQKVEIMASSDRFKFKTLSPKCHQWDVFVEFKLTAKFYSTLIQSLCGKIIEKEIQKISI